ncbi:MAG TPA: SlyX family protein [Nevskiaceae bacterium]|nr:SlyX family protein [Nevskiaceae bacterium]
MNDQRLIELEERFAYQEATLRDLNDVITRQQQQIDRLEQICRMLVERVARQDISKGTPEEEIPPHY